MAVDKNKINIDIKKETIKIKIALSVISSIIGTLLILGIEYISGDNNKIELIILFIILMSTVVHTTLKEFDIENKILKKKAMK